MRIAQYEYVQWRMADSKSNLSINAAVMNCLARCSESEASYVCLGDFLEKLQEMGWSKSDVLAVQTAVLPMLGELRASTTLGVGVVRMAAGWPGNTGSAVR
jgi:hypothetical protein